MRFLSVAVWLAGGEVGAEAVGGEGGAGAGVGCSSRGLPPPLASTCPPPDDPSPSPSPSSVRISHNVCPTLTVSPSWTLIEWTIPGVGLVNSALPLALPLYP